MRTPRTTRLLAPALLVIFSIAAGLARAQDDVGAIIARVEAPQTTGARELDTLSLPELMARLHVPGFSIAVVKDFRSDAA